MKRTKNNQILYRIFVELLSLIVCFNLCVPVRALGPGDVPGGGDYSDNDGADTEIDPDDIPDDGDDDADADADADADEIGRAHV